MMRNRIKPFQYHYRKHFLLTNNVPWTKLKKRLLLRHDTRVWLPPPLFLGGWYLSKMKEGGGQDCLLKMGGSCIYGVPYRREGGGEHYFSLMMYGYCSNNVLHLLSFSLKMLIFLLNPFNKWGCYYIESNVA